MYEVLFFFLLLFTFGHQWHWPVGKVDDKRMCGNIDVRVVGGGMYKQSIMSTQPGLNTANLFYD